MKIIKAGHEHIPHEGVTPYQFIERVGRTCYKSEDKITEDSAVKFVKGLVSRGHIAMIEHFWVHLSYSGDYRILYDKIEYFVTNDLNDLGDYSTLFRFMQVTNDIKSKTVLLSCPIRVFTELSNRKLVQDNIPLLIREMFHAVQKEYFDFFNETATFFREDRVLTNQFVVWNESDFIFMMKEAGLPEQEIMKHNTHTPLTSFVTEVYHMNWFVTVLAVLHRRVQDNVITVRISLERRLRSLNLCGCPAKMSLNGKIGNGQSEPVKCNILSC